MTDGSAGPGKYSAARWNTVPVEVGRRVVVRRALTEEERSGGISQLATDVIGHVVSTEPFVVRPQLPGGKRAAADAPVVDFSEHEVLVIKALPDRPVRNSDIRAVEVATAKAFPGIEHTWAGGWLMRAGDGITERSNSAIPLGHSAGTTPVPLKDITEFYERHELPVRIAVPDRLCKPAEQLILGDGWTRGPEIVVMTRDVEDLPLPDVSLIHATFQSLDQPDDEWLSLYHFRGQALPRKALELLMTKIDGRMTFGRLVVDGQTVAITRGTLTDSDDGRTWMGFSAVEVAPDWRRKGLGTALGLHMMHWGAQHGADAVYLQVIATNEPGLAMYQGLGFTEQHRHRYAEWTG